MAVDSFLKLDGIPGESTDKHHPGEVVLESFSFGLANAGGHATGAGHGAGKASFQDFHFTHKTDRASPTLMLHCADGRHIPNGTITVRKAGGNAAEGAPFEFLFIKMTDIVVTSVADTELNGDLPVESVSFAFSKISVEYKEQKADGALGATVDFAWDLKANKKV